MHGLNFRNMGTPFSWILKKKYDYWWRNTDLQRLTGRFKLPLLAGIGRFQQNQGEIVAHFVWFYEPWCFQSIRKLISCTIIVSITMEEKHNKMSKLFIGQSMDHFCILDKLYVFLFFTQKLQITSTYLT